MKSALFVFVIVVCATPAFAQCPTVGKLCDGVVEASSADFWEKWDAAEYVVYGTPVSATGCMAPGEISGIGTYDGPQPGGCSILLVVREAWKGVEVPQSFNISTSWMYNYPMQIGPMPGFVIWSAEFCALTVETFTDSVFFLREVDGQMSTYSCYGTNIYNRDWLVAEIGEPTPTSQSSWGSLKATYR